MNNIKQLLKSNLRFAMRLTVLLLLIASIISCVSAQAHDPDAGLGEYEPS